MRLKPGLLRLRFHPFVAVALLLSAVAAASGSAPTAYQSRAAGGPGNASENPLGLNSGYKIDRGDMLRISVAGEPQLSETVFVDPSGSVALPLVLSVPVAGLTVPQGQALLQARLGKYLRHPQVSIVIEQASQFLVYVTGNVVRPGAYPLVKGLDVKEAIEEAGGLTKGAKAKRIYIVLRSTRKDKRKVDYAALSRGRKRKEDFLLAAGDEVVVP